MASWLLPRSKWSPTRLSLCRDVFSKTARAAATLAAVPSKPHFSTLSATEDTLSPSMIALRQQRYPHLGLNLDVFEDALEEYGADEATYPEIAAARKPCHVLLQLVRNGNYEDAARVYADLMNIGVEIEPNFYYAVIARRSLQIRGLRAEVTSEHRLMDFVRWYSLVPSAEPPYNQFTSWHSPALKSSHSRKPSLHKLMHAVFFSSPVPDIPLAIQFALISAAKGWAALTSAPTVVFVVRNAPPAISLKFLERLEKADAQFFDGRDSGAARWYRRRASTTYGLAIRVHCTAGRLDAAVDVLQHAVQQGLVVNKFTSEFLLTYLRSGGSAERLQQATTILRSIVEPEAAQYEVSVAPDTFFTPNVSVPSTPSHASFAHALIRAPPADAPLPTVLRFLKSSFSSGRSVAPSLLMRFMDLYKQTGRTRALVSLRIRAYHSPKQQQSIAQWTLGEMLYHVQNTSRRGVLLAFGYHFHAVGIPSRATKFLIKLSKRPQLFLTGGPEWEAVEKVIPSGYALRNKMWPSSHHTALVWRAIAQDVASSDELEALYQELLAQITLAYNPDGVTAAGDIVENPLMAVHEPDSLSTDRMRQMAYLQPVPSPTQFDSAHFNVFLEYYSIRREIAWVKGILTDMYRLGIQPSVETFTRVAAGFARAGDLEEVDALLTKMEEAPEHLDTSVEMSPDNPQFVRPTPETYSSVVRGLMSQQMYSSALEVAKRMYVKCGYVSGTNPAVDAVLTELLSEVEHG